MSTPSDDRDTALGLERLRGELREGLASIQGALDLLVLRSRQTEKAQAEHQTRLDKHDARLDALEAHRAVTEGHAGQLDRQEDRLGQVEKRVWAIGGGVVLAAVVVEIAASFIK